MKNLLHKIFATRLWALFLKELRQIKRDRRLIASLIVPPTIQILIFGFALNPEVTNLRLGVVDESRSATSRELISAFVESQSFQVRSFYESGEALGAALREGKLDAGLIIPNDFARKRQRRETADVQLLFDASDSNTAGIAAGYASRIIAALNQRDAINGRAIAINSPPMPKPEGKISSWVALLYNPGLESAWFIITGTLGILLVLNGSLIASASLVKEKEIGTVEQLLMTPAEASEIIIAKIAPLFLLLLIDIGLALGVGYAVFDVPVRGNLLLLCSAGGLCIFAGIGIGTFIATFTRSQQQAQLLIFFINPPLALLSGATTPIEGMPDWLQPLTYLNPIRHFATIARGIMLKAAGMEVLYPHLLALLAFAVLLVGISAWRFRKQLG
ncbi:MAG: ABC transporter permease [Acidobacteriota bacterium]